MERICADEFNRCIEPVQRVLKDCKVDVARVTDVVLVGGSTRIPRIRALLQGVLDREPNASINPDEAVAYGAAVQAAIITGATEDQHEGALGQLLLVDVAPLSLGVETAGHFMSVLISRNSAVPIAAKKLYSTDRDNQSAVDINVYEGERPDVRDNIHLGKVSLEGIPPAPAGVPRIAVTFALDQDGLLNVSATEEASGQSCSIRITNEQGVGRLSAAEIQAMVAAADDAVAGDHQKRLAGRARQRCLALCEQIREAVRHLSSVLTDKEQLRVLKDLDYTDTWLEAHPDAAAAVFMREHRALERKVDHTLRTAYRAFVDAGNAAPAPCTGAAATALKAAQEEEAIKGKQPDVM
jgi:L1 cell adhesion molecule like protein